MRAASREQPSAVDLLPNQKSMTYIKLAWTWLVTSSADPANTSLTVKSGLVTLATYITVVAGLAHISLPSDVLTQLIDSIVSFVQGFLMILSSTIAIIAFIRKIKRTFDGTNAAVQ
jgi:hypothetical protein